MLNAGMPITRSFQSLQKGGADGRLFSKIGTQIAAGHSITEVIEQHAQSFDRLDRTLIAVGEQTGQLAEMFEALSQWYTFRQRLRRTVRAGMVLPILMIHALALIAPVVPFALGGFDVSVYVNGFLRIIAIFYIPALIILAIIYLTPKEGLMRWMLDAFIMRIPLLGSAIRELELSRYSNVFSITYKAGVPIARCVEMATDAVGNQVMRRKLSGACDKVAQGDEMSAGFSRSLPSDFICVWEVGEESGELDQSALRLSKNYADKAEMRFSVIAEWVPRIIYAIVSCVMIYYIFKGFGMIYGTVL